MTTTAEVRRARRAYLIAATWVPAAITTAAVTLMLVWLAELPPEIAVHWGPGGDPDRFGPGWSAPLLAAGVGYGLAGLFAAIGTGAARSGEWGPMLRFLGSLGCGTTFLLMTLVAGSVAMQRGLEDSADSPSVIPILLVSAVVGIAAGVVAWFAQPAVSVSGGTVATPAAAIRLEPGERAVWLRTTAMARPALVAIVGVAILMGVLAIVAGVIGGDLWLLFAAMAVLFAVLTATTCVFRVSVSDAGLRVASVAGFPRFSVALDDVVGVSAVRVEPMAQFGGWGIRIGAGGRFGIVLRTGEAIQVERRRGGPFVVTVDDAATGAALLAALAAREAAPSR